MEIKSMKLNKAPSSESTKDFYNSLVDGETKRGILGIDKRYNVQQIINSPSTKKYFINCFKRYLKKTDKVLDFGCGPGGFLCSIAPYCGEITGVDIVENFVDLCKKSIENEGLTNARAIVIKPNKLPFENNSLDAVMMIDAIHHLEDIDSTMPDIFRVLKPGGRLLILEPNKLNPLIYLVHLLDENERGLLKVGTPKVYKKMFADKLAIEEVSFNGIVIGPQTKTYLAIADFLNHKFLKPIIGWLNPKIFISGKLMDSTLDEKNYPDH